MDQPDIAQAILATWPPERTKQIGPFLLAENQRGGNRVRAARLTDATATGASVSMADIEAASKAMGQLGQPDLFMVLSGQEALDTRLDQTGYQIKDPTLALTVPTAQLAAAPPPVTIFETWPPLAIQTEIWAEGGVGPDRLAIMARANGKKISLFGRINDRPAGTAYIACSDKLAMLHALEVLPTARRRGLAVHMMRAAGLWAQTQGIETFSVLVTRENQPARNLYASLGFEAVGHYHYRTKTA